MRRQVCSKQKAVNEGLLRRPADHLNFDFSLAQRNTAATHSTLLQALDTVAGTLHCCRHSTLLQALDTVAGTPVFFKMFLLWDLYNHLLAQHRCNLEPAAAKCFSFS